MKLKLLAAFTFMGMLCFGQSEIPELDKSPLDVIYYPVNYPILKVQDKINGRPSARIIYSRPLKKGRMVFGDLIEYGEIWRLGANEATELELFKDAVIAGKKIKKGRYTLFCIPEKDNWTLIINTENNVWGAFAYNKDLDVARINLVPEYSDKPVEPFSIIFKEEEAGVNLVFAWDTTSVSVPISFK